LAMVIRVLDESSERSFPDRQLRGPIFYLAPFSLGHMLARKRSI
jgi:hypothetical protein